MEGVVVVLISLCSDVTCFALEIYDHLLDVLNIFMYLFSLYLEREREGGREIENG